MLNQFLRRLHRRFFGASRGFGHPVPASVFDEEFRSGHWRLLDSSDEVARYDLLVALVREHHTHPVLLDAGCGSGRLARHFRPEDLAVYHGVDLSTEAIHLARTRAPQGSILTTADLETWRPPDHYDVIVVNEVVGYFHDPAAILLKLTAALRPGGALIVSLYRWGNAAAIWRRIDTRFHTLRSTSATNSVRDKYWDIRILAPLVRDATNPPANP